MADTRFPATPAAPAVDIDVRGWPRPPIRSGIERELRPLGAPGERMWRPPPLTV